MKVKLSGAQGTRILGTTDRIDHRVREKKVIQPSGPQPEPSNNPPFSRWAGKPYLYIESHMLQMSADETGQMSAVETGQMSAVETRQMYSIETGQRPGRELKDRKTQWFLSDPGGGNLANPAWGL